MRSLSKLPEPGILAENHVAWLQEYLQDLSSDAKRTRYRHPDIKSTLKLETHEKCVYCESRIGHNTPGDIEHKIPSSKDRTKHFIWSNLTIACGECNRRKNSYYQEHDGFLDPYTDDVEQYLDFEGPVVTSKPGEVRGEVFVATLELCSANRLSLVTQKIAKINELRHILERYNSADPGPLKEVLKRQLIEMSRPGGEYSAMVRSAVRAKGYAELVE
ncbi:MAG: HNH endonuclease [Ideonella sp.]|nr:HNH endonuclease [Ideonella sp.]